MPARSSQPAAAAAAAASSSSSASPSERPRARSRSRTRDTPSRASAKPAQRSAVSPAARSSAHTPASASVADASLVGYATEANTDALALSKLPPHAVHNPLAQPTLLSTAIGFVFVALCAVWAVFVYRGVRDYMHGARTSVPDVSIATLGIPLFLACVALEFVFSLLLGQKVYRMNDSITSFANGLLQTLIDVTLFGKLSDVLGVTFVTAIPYAAIYENYRVAELDGFWGFVLMLLMRDFCYYWFHRASHRMAWAWAVHGVHHQPNEFNYSVNISQGAMQRMVEAFFHAPLALFFHPALYMTVFPMEKIFGFMTHTRLLNKMYLLEYVFITPSLHRVHHAGAPSKYIDKNYGEMLCIWDRLFGTFQDECEPIVFGHVHPHQSWDPLRNQTALWSEIRRKAARCTSWRDKFLCYVKPPGWNPRNNTEFGCPDTTPYSARKYDSDLPWSLTAYAIVNQVVNLALGIYLIQHYRAVPETWQLFVLIGFNVLSLTCVGRLYDHNPSVRWLERVRLTVAPLVVNFVLLALPATSLPRVLASAEAMYALNAFLLLNFAAGNLLLTQNAALFAAETPEERKKRVWIPEAGREFGAKLAAAASKAA